MEMTNEGIIVGGSHAGEILKSDRPIVNLHELIPSFASVLEDGGGGALCSVTIERYDWIDLCEDGRKFGIWSFIIPETGKSQWLRELTRVYKSAKTGVSENEFEEALNSLKGLRYLTHGDISPVINTIGEIMVRLIIERDEAVGK